MERPTRPPDDEHYCATCWCVISIGATWIVVNGEPQCQRCAYEAALKEAAPHGR